MVTTTHVYGDAVLSMPYRLREEKGEELKKELNSFRGGLLLPYLTMVVCSPGSVMTPNTYMSLSPKMKLCQETPSLQEYMISEEGAWW